ncbi:MAG: VWA domain-containing protein [Pyrinomonadaceae bacterium]
MKRLTTGILLIAAMAAAVVAQADRSTRPRVATTPTPPVIANDTYKNPAPATPPVLIGGNKRPTPAATSTPPLNEDDEVIKIETNLVTMPVSVLDRDGRFISGLQQDDFKIFENGVEQKIDYFQSVEQPFTVILMIDVSPSTQFKIDQIHNAAITFIDKLRPSEQVMVIAFDDKVRVLSPITNNRAMLRNAIRQAQFGDGTSLYDAVNFAIDDQLRHIQGRKAVVLFSDGVDTTSQKANYDSTLRETEEVDALFYTIRYDTSNDMYGGGSPRWPQPQRKPTLGGILGAILMGGNVNIGGGGSSRGQNPTEYAKGKQYLQMLAQNSGGRAFEAQSMYNLDAAFSGIAEELRRQYSLGYYPETVGKIGDRKQIKIRVMRPSVVVRAKNSYIVGQTNRTVAGK